MQRGHGQEVHLDKQISLIDCPGIVVASTDEDTVANVVLRNCVRVEQIEDPLRPVEMIVKVCAPLAIVVVLIHNTTQRCTPESLQEIYELPAFRDSNEFLALLAKKKGRLRKVCLVADVSRCAQSTRTGWASGCRGDGPLSAARLELGSHSILHASSSHDCRWCSTRGTDIRGTDRVVDCEWVLGGIRH
jgi:hypothetical protein